MRTKHKSICTLSRERVRKKRRKNKKKKKRREKSWEKSWDGLKLAGVEKGGLEME